MNDEKLDLILNVVSDIRVKVDRIEARLTRLEDYIESAVLAKL